MGKKNTIEIFSPYFVILTCQTPPLLNSMANVEACCAQLKTAAQSRMEGIFLRLIQTLNEHRDVPTRWQQRKASKQPRAAPGSALVTRAEAFLS